MRCDLPSSQESECRESSLGCFSAFHVFSFFPTGSASRGSISSQRWYSAPPPPCDPQRPVRYDDSEKELHSIFRQFDQVLPAVQHPARDGDPPSQKRHVADLQAMEFGGRIRRGVFFFTTRRYRDWWGSGSVSRKTKRGGMSLCWACNVELALELRNRTTKRSHPLKGCCHLLI